MSSNLDKPLFNITLGDLKNVIKEVLDERDAQDILKAEQKKFVYGIAGIASLLGCSTSTAQRIKSSGVIDEAISQQGKTIVVNVEHALALIKVSKWRNATSLSAVNVSR